MYPPLYYTNNDPIFLDEVMREYSFAVITTSLNDEILATHLPVIFKNEGKFGTLYGHVAANNPQAKHFEAQARTMIVFNGPHAYISADWYDAPEKRVPTWNYISVQARGQTEILPKDQWMAEMETLVKKYEPNDDWTISRAQAYAEQLMRGILYFKMPITSIQGYEKMSQNKGYSENQTVISKLRAREEDETAEAMTRAMNRKTKTTLKND